MNDPATIQAVLEDATRRLDAVSDSARLDAELLLARAIDMPRSYLFAHPEEPLDETTVDRFHAALDRRLAGEPMAYIAGVREFWSLELMVTPATLVPRPETELLVDLALRENRCQRRSTRGRPAEREAARSSQHRIPRR
jgi:release factor glutamine methyltransferase